MTRNIGILGSTGSIGTQALEVIDEIGKINVVALSTNENIALLEQQIRKYKPRIVAVMDTEKAAVLKKNVKDMNVKVVDGMEGLIEISTLSEIDTVLTSVVGTIGLIPTIKAIEAGKNIALANKETLVSAGELVMGLAKEKGVKIYPVDSEHSAIFQCMQGNNPDEIHKIILTASGGPFRGKNRSELEDVSVNQALKHPNWSMGRKISIDSATLMNKGLEIIEARWLFDLPTEKIEVIVHPQSIIHSMVEYKDSSIIAQLGQPDMKVPIQYALTYPKREQNAFQKLDLVQVGMLTFEKPDINTFQCLRLAIEAVGKAGTAPAVVNAANEAAVDLFLNEKICFLDIPRLIELAVDAHTFIPQPTLEQILEIDAWAKEFIYTSFEERMEK